MFLRADRRQRAAGDSTKPYESAPSPICCCRISGRRATALSGGSRGDFTRAVSFGAIGVGVFAVLFYGAAWITWQLDDYDELGDYLLRLGLSWIFMTFLAFLTFSGIVTALSTFFLSDDLRLLLTAPVAARRLFYARFARTVVQSSWMVMVFLTPVLLGVGIGALRPPPST